MLLALEPSLKEKIEKQYEEWMACCPNKKREVDAWIKSADEDEAVCMKYLYAYMHPEYFEGTVLCNRDWIIFFIQ